MYENCILFFKRDGSGQISPSELHQVFHALEIKVKESEVNDIMKQMDIDGKPYTYSTKKELSCDESGKGHGKIILVKNGGF